MVLITLVHGLSILLLLKIHNYVVNSHTSRFFYDAKVKTSKGLFFTLRVVLCECCIHLNYIMLI